MRQRPTKRLACVAISGLVLLALQAPQLAAQPDQRPPGWTDITHGADSAPDYQRLFASDRVHEMHIRIAPEDYLAMQADLETIRPAWVARIPGLQPAGGRPAQALTNGFDGLMSNMLERFEAAAAACSELEAEASCSLNGNAGRCQAGPATDLICLPEPVGGPAALPIPAPPPGSAFFLPQGQGGGSFGALAPVLTLRDPIYVPVTVSHDGLSWTAVGMRYKGNSSLSAASMGRSAKIPFRLDFDRYEDEVPGTRNQRFYGFDRLTFASNYYDDSLLKEILATEIFRDQGVPAARAAFYRIFVDTGKGEEYWGLYTMIEDPADGAMLDAQFGDDDGNLYKPNGPGANWSAFNPAGFEKKNHEKAADFSDVESAMAALHAPRTNAAAWREGLEAHFAVDGFLRWLAVNTLIGNWDAYGRMAHNYYLYGDPADADRLHWIPWDHNISFATGSLPEGNPSSAPGGSDMLHRQVGDAWPLISYLMSDPVYAARYRELLELALDGLMEPDRFAARVRELHALIAAYVVGEQGEKAPRTTLSSPQAFEDSADSLIRAAATLHEQARAALASPD